MKQRIQMDPTQNHCIELCLYPYLQTKRDFYTEILKSFDFSQLYTFHARTTITTYNDNNISITEISQTNYRHSKSQELHLFAAGRHINKRKKKQTCYLLPTAGFATVSIQFQSRDTKDYQVSTSQMLLLTAFDSITENVSLSTLQKRIPCLSKTEFIATLHSLSDAKNGLLVQTKDSVRLVSNPKNTISNYDCDVMHKSNQWKMIICVIQAHIVQFGKKYRRNWVKVEHIVSYVLHKTKNHTELHNMTRSEYLALIQHSIEQVVSNEYFSFSSDKNKMLYIV